MATLSVSAPVSALVEGILREDKPLADLLKVGNFGLGTFNDLDGEMVVLDGIVYRMDIDGVAHQVDLSVCSPYACVTDFRPDASFALGACDTYGDFLARLSDKLRSRNYIYALRIHGAYRSIHTRTVPKQASYRPLVDVAHDQKDTTLVNACGTLVGFWTPDYMQSISVPGFHLHLITDDRTRGGHLISCIPSEVTVSVQEIHHLDLELPTTRDFGNLSFHRDSAHDLQQAEH